MAIVMEEFGQKLSLFDSTKQHSRVDLTIDLLKDITKDIICYTIVNSRDVVQKLISFAPKTVLCSGATITSVSLMSISDEDSSVKKCIAISLATLGLGMSVLARMELKESKESKELQMMKMIICV